MMIPISGLSVLPTTGMRRREILALRWKNFDFERGEVRVIEKT
jgi:integrase